MSGTFSRRASVECRSPRQKLFQIKQSMFKETTNPNHHLTANHSDQKQKPSNITRRSRHTVQTDCSRICHNHTLNAPAEVEDLTESRTQFAQTEPRRAIFPTSNTSKPLKKVRAFPRSPGRNTLSQKPNHIKNTFFWSLTFPSTPDTSPSSVPGEDANALCTHSGRVSAFLCPLHRRPRLFNELHMLTASLFISHST